MRDGLHVEEANVHLGFDVDPLPHLQGEGAELGQQPNALVPAATRCPPPWDTSGDATNLKEVFEGDALVHLVRPLCAARERR